MHKEGANWFFLPVVPPDEPVSPVVPPEVSVVEQPNTMDPVARYKKNRVHRYSDQMACSTQQLEDQGLIAWVLVLRGSLSHLEERP